ncbi:hypothetical protein [Thauera sp. 63]|uniref:hypothetical protein n=1 Tax=Thauera sp. 63 TaxID=497321 RepID=UPI0002CF2785|nr:hypothetical protein [Thauera sp. 63]ENO80316.1 hypothetical protein C664_01200 [Thauera sp. 63]
MDQTASITPADAERMRQWFDAVQDLNPGYLEQADYELAARLYQALGLRIPQSIHERLVAARIDRLARRYTPDPYKNGL